MAQLAKFPESVVRKVAVELGLEPSERHNMITMLRFIQDSPGFDLRFVVALMENYLCQEQEEQRLRREQQEQCLRFEREQQEKRLEREQQEKRLEREQQEKRLEREQEEKRLEREFEERESERRHQLELARLQASAAPENNRRDPEVRQMNSARPTIDIRRFVNEYDPKECDISLFLTTFERQVTQLEVPEDEWRLYLIRLLPVEDRELLNRQSEEDARDYDAAKEVLLKKHKLSPEKLRQMFKNYAKKPGQTWENVAYQLQNYCRGWTSGLNVTTFDELINLLVTDAMKSLVPKNVREFHLDKWSEWIEPSILAEKLDRYDVLIEENKVKNDSSNDSDKNKSKSNQNQKFQPKFNKWKTFNNNEKKGEEQKKIVNNRSRSKERDYEKRREMYCSFCKRRNHLRNDCWILKKELEKEVKERETKTVNRVQNQEDEEIKEDPMTRFMFKGLANGIPVDITRDTGSNMDLVSHHYVQPEMYTGEFVWLKSPLSDENYCVPLAEIQLTGSFGELFAKAAVIKSRKMNEPYLLGNVTARQLEEITQSKLLPSEINRVITRAQKLQQEREQQEEEERRQQEGELFTNLEDIPEVDEPDDDVYIDAEPSEEEETALKLINVSREELVRMQEEDVSLKDLPVVMSDSPEAASHRGFLKRDGLMLFRKRDRMNDVKELIVVPKPIRRALLELCHQGTSCHLGVTKTAELLTRHFYWPKCGSEIAGYVRTCEPCQYAGKSGDLSKIPLKTVPIVEEIFYKINADICGPLKETADGKKYLLTAICVASRYPDAVILKDTTSCSIVNGLQENKVYHLNQIKPFYQRQEEVNFVATVQQPSEVSELQAVLDDASTLEHLTTQQALELRELLGKYDKIFTAVPGKTDLVTLDVELVDDVPVRSRAYRLTPRQSDIVQKEVEKMLKLGIIEEGESDYVSPVVLDKVPRKDYQIDVVHRKNYKRRRRRRTQ